MGIVTRINQKIVTIGRHAEKYSLTGPVSDSKEVEVLGTPRHRSDGEFLHFVVAELPQRQQSSLAVTVLVSEVFIVTEIYTEQ